MGTVVLGRPDGPRIEIATLGARLASVSLPGADPASPRIELTLQQPPGPVVDPRFRFMGSTIGRHANRIAGARFDLDGNEFRLTPNEGPNQLHGGPGGFHACEWTVMGEPTAERVQLELISPDGDQGFPGRVHATVTYTLEDDPGGDLVIDLRFAATTDAPTIVNLTNHAYWNLSGGTEPTVAGHRLALGFDSVVATDASGIPTPDSPLAVAAAGLAVDPTRPLADRLARGGIDHCFVHPNVPPGAPCVVLEHPASGRVLRVTTDEPGVQVYTGDHFDPAHAAIAFEAQRWPNSPNRPDFPSAVLRPGETYRHHTSYRLTE